MDSPAAETRYETIEVAEGVTVRSGYGLGAEWYADLEDFEQPAHRPSRASNMLGAAMLTNSLEF